MTNKTDGLLVLSDGTVFRGKVFGALRGPENPVVGEVVFNTSMYGYQEILTDPSYAGQIMCFTYPHIGNVGCNEEDIESPHFQPEGVIIRHQSKVVSNFRATQSFEDYLRESDKMGISGVDTRSLVIHIRDKGAQMGALAAAGPEAREVLLSAATAAGTMDGKDFVKQVTCEESYSWSERVWELGAEKRIFSQEELLARPHVVALDCGMKFNISRLLVESGFRVTVVPAGISAEDILLLKPDALFISNGPGDPAALDYIAQSVKKLLGKFPIFGICLGLQILARAVGAKTYKLKFGHRGANHPVMDLKTRKVEITVQNHGFAVDGDSIPADCEMSHVNLNDQTVEGISMPNQLAFCVQYHPEASAGPHDSKYLFRRFFEMVIGYQGSREN